MLKKAKIVIFLALLVLAASTIYADTELNPLLIIYNDIKIGVTDFKKVENAIQCLNSDKSITEPLIIGRSNILHISWTWIGPTHRDDGSAPTSRLEISVHHTGLDAGKIQRAKYWYSNPIWISREK